MKTVKYEVDLANLPPLTDAQKAEIEALAKAKKIDFSDIPKTMDSDTPKLWESRTKHPGSPGTA